MRFVSILALGLMLGTGTSLAVAPQAIAAKKEKAPAPPKLKLSKPFADGFNAALTPLNAGDFAGAKAGWQALQPLITSDDERYQSAVLAWQIGSRANDRALQYEATQQFQASATTSAEEKSKFQFVGGVLNPDPKAGLAQQVAAYNAGYRDDTIALNISNSYYQAGDGAQGGVWAQKFFDEQAAAGKPVQLDYYAITLNNAIKARDTAGQLRWSQALAAHSLIPDHWRVASDVALRNNPQADGQVALDVMRVQRKANALRPEDYRIYVDSADPVRLPAEVIRVLNEGKASGALRGNEAFYTEAMAKANGRLAADKASLATADRDAQAGRDGKSAQGSADAFLSYGEYAHAATLYELALTKGGVDAGRVNTRLGIAKVELNDLAGAKAAFEKVTGVWKTSAQLWLAWVQAKTSNAPTTLAAATPAAPAPAPAK